MKSFLDSKLICLWPQLINYTFFLGSPGKPGNVGPAGPPGPKGEAGVSTGGVVYSRWGRKHCPSGTNELYSGIMQMSSIL